MRTIGVRAAKVMGTNLPTLVRVVNIGGELKMNPNGSLTKAGKSSYRRLLRENKVHSIEDLIEKMRKGIVEHLQKTSAAREREIEAWKRSRIVPPEKMKLVINI